MARASAVSTRAVRTWCPYTPGAEVTDATVRLPQRQVVNCMVTRKVIEELCQLMWLVSGGAEDSSKGETGQAAKAVAVTAAGETGQAAANGSSPTPQGEGAVVACNGHGSGASGAAAAPGEPSAAAAGGTQGQSEAGGLVGCQGQEGQAGGGALAEAGAAVGSHSLTPYAAKERALLEEFLTIIKRVEVTAARHHSKHAAAAAAAGGPAAGAAQQQQQPEAGLGSGGGEEGAAAATLLPPLGMPGMQGQSLTEALQVGGGSAG